VRHHELKAAGQKSPMMRKNTIPVDKLDTHSSSPVTHLARIEVGVAEMKKFLENEIVLRVAEALKKIGYAHVTLDLQGYRRGSTNELNPTPISFRNERERTHLQE
jgi:PP-loop superfamily ATP-utilizing enzyme